MIDFSALGPQPNVYGSGGMSRTPGPRLPSDFLSGMGGGAPPAGGAAPLGSAPMNLLPSGTAASQPGTPDFSSFLRMMMAGLGGGMQAQQPGGMASLLGQPSAPPASPLANVLQRRPLPAGGLF